MKISRSRLKKIILEEKRRILNEASINRLNRIIKEEYDLFLKEQKSQKALKTINRIIKEELAKSKKR